MLRRSLLLMLLLSACAGPSVHRAPPEHSALATVDAEAQRAPVASTLASPDPLEASSCALPAAPNAACQEPVEPHHHGAVSTPEPVDTPMAAAKVTDPVCKMSIDPKTAGGGTLTHQGKQHWFCSSSCRRKFLTQNPGAK